MFWNIIAAFVTLTSCHERRKCSTINKAFELLLDGRTFTVRRKMPMFTPSKRAQTVEEVMSDIPTTSAFLRRQRHRSVWASVESLTSLDIDEILSTCCENWYFEETVVPCTSQDIQVSEDLVESVQEPKTVVNAKTPSCPEKNTIVVQAEVHVDTALKTVSAPNDSFYQSLYSYHDPKRWEKEDSFYAYSSDEEDNPVGTRVVVAEVHIFESEADRNTICEESRVTPTDVQVEVAEERRPLKNGCVYCAPLEITFEGTETITLSDPKEVTQKTKKPGLWKKFSRALGRAGRRLRRLVCGCLMEEEFDDSDLYILEFKARGIDVVVV